MPTSRPSGSNAPKVRPGVYDPAPAGPLRVVDRLARCSRAAEQVVRGAQLAVAKRADRMPAQAGRPTW